MILQTEFLSREQFENYHATWQDLYISIRGFDECESRKAKLQGTWYDGIFVQFNDTNEESNEAFSDSDALMIIDFLLPYQSAELQFDLYIHCYAGISRSAAVAKFADEIFSYRKNPRLKHYTLYNKRVYSTLKRVFAEGVY